MVKATENSQTGVKPSQKPLEEMGRFNEELASAGVIVAGDGLRPGGDGKRVRFSGDQRTELNGRVCEA